MCKKGDNNEGVLCDNCNGAYHLACLVPPLATVPEGNCWTILNVVSCGWMPLDVVGCCWMLLDAVGCLWISLVDVGCHWLSFDVVVPLPIDVVQETGTQ